MVVAKYLLSKVSDMPAEMSAAAMAVMISGLRHLITKKMRLDESNSRFSSGFEFILVRV